MMHAKLRAHIKRVLPEICEGGTTMTYRQALAVLETSRFIATAEVDGEIRAFGECRVNPVSPHRWTVSCAVESAFQGMGLGRRVLSEALAFADEHGAEYVDGVAWAHNARVLKLDFSLGFKPVGRVNDAYRRDGVSLDQILLVRKAAWLPAQQSE